MAVSYSGQIAQLAGQPADGRWMPHRIRATRAFDRACQLTGLSSAELCRRLAPMIEKAHPISRQTLADWRHGTRSVPLVAFLATCELAELRPPMIFALADEERDGDHRPHAGTRGGD